MYAWANGTSGMFTQDNFYILTAIEVDTLQTSIEVIYDNLNILCNSRGLDLRRYFGLTSIME